MYSVPKIEQPTRWQYPLINYIEIENKDEGNEVTTSDAIGCFEKSNNESKAIETGIILLIEKGVIFKK